MRVERLAPPCAISLQGSAYVRIASNRAFVICFHPVAIDLIAECFAPPNETTLY